MYYIVGLGNPGAEYAGTRHNIGFTLVTSFIEHANLPSLHESKTYNGLVSEGVLENAEVTVLLPQTFMNASGGAVAKLVSKSDIENLIVVYDDVDLPFGEIKISFGRGDGGHNGIKSIIASLGTQEFVRLRVGVARKSLWTGKVVRPKGEKLASFVLGAFSSSEQKELPSLEKKVTEVLCTFISKGRESTMNQFN